VTNIIIRKIDPDEPGSFRLRLKLMEVSADLQTVRDDALEQLKVYRRLVDLIISRMRTDDGSSLDDAIDMLSINQFEALLSGLQRPDESLDETSPNQSTPSSKPGRAKKVRRQTS
jgi:hypothetical protein